MSTDNTRTDRPKTTTAPTRREVAEVVAEATEATLHGTPDHARAERSSAPAAGTTAAQTQRYGDLELRFTSTFTDSSTTRGMIIQNPVPPSGWRSLGTVLCHPSEDVALVVKDCSAQGDLLKSPTGFTRLAELKAGHIHYATIWQPNAPSGYAALGVYVTPAGSTPAPDAVACVKKTHNGRTYARQAELSTSGALTWFRHNVTPPYPHGDAEEHLLLPVGTMSYNPDPNPAPTATTWILDLPAVVDKLDGPDTPDLENYNSPPAQTIITDRAVTVPFFLVADPARTRRWKAEHSPFYKILRKRTFALVRHVDYRGAGGGQISESVTQGVSTEKSEEFSLTTGITVGVSVGVEASAKPFGVGASTTVETSVSTSIEMGYSRRYGVTSMESKTVGVTYEVPADHAGALWSEKHELIPVRADDSTVTNATLTFDSGSYVGRTYPHTDQAPPKVSDPTPAATTADGTPIPNLWENLDQIEVIPAGT
ncbi:Vps62-related protein [Nonomuraea sp. NPDC050404]|uniref:Vps62-related protein n=1 Tax=Nonomuraea sp. NPDC050404 TaxID=3155783 RepID=UPI0033D559F3